MTDPQARNGGRPRVLILGGGFGGIGTAQKLRKRTARGHDLRVAGMTLDNGEEAELELLTREETR